MSGTVDEVSFKTDVQNNRCAAYLAILCVLLIAGGEVNFHTNFFTTPGAGYKLELKWFSHQAKIGC